MKALRGPGALVRKPPHRLSFAQVFHEVKKISN